MTSCNGHGVQFVNRKAFGNTLTEETHIWRTNIANIGVGAKSAFAETVYTYMYMIINKVGSGLTIFAKIYLKVSFKKS